MPFGLGRKKAQPTVDRQRQVDLSYVATQLGEGSLSFIHGCDSDITNASVSLQNISLMEPEGAASHADGSGIKEKLARGLYFYVAQPYISEPYEELAEVDRGTVTINVDGIVFAGKSRHLGVGFGAIESISHSQNGIAIVTRNGAQKICFEGANRVVFAIKVQDRIYNVSLSGKLMRLIVEGMIKISFSSRSATSST